MKRMLAITIILLLCCGCSRVDSQMNRALALRERILNSEGCTFTTNITSDYGDRIYTFSMDCRADASGAVDFTVTAPETISGICGVLTEGEGKLTFDDQALFFEMLADGQVSPVSAPWLFMNTLIGGYIKACGREDRGLLIQIDDSYKEKALQLNIRTDQNDLPVSAEIFWQGMRIVSMDVENFTFV